MDIEIGDRPAIRQATAEDLQNVLAQDFETPLVLARNYGDRLEATVTDDGGCRLAYLEAVTGRWHETDATLTRDQVAAALLDFYEGNWHWRQRHSWRTVVRS